MDGVGRGVVLRDGHTRQSPHRVIVGSHTVSCNIMQFLTDNSMYVAAIIATVILVGILLYISRVDARLRKLEREEK